MKTWHVIAIWLLCAVLGYAGPGTYFAHRINGIDAAQLGFGVSIAFGIALVVALLLTTRWAGHIDDARPEAESSARRRLLLWAAGLTGGLLVSGGGALARVWGWLTTSNSVTGRPGVPHTHRTPSESWQGARVQAYRRLGRTGFEISDISLGSGGMAGDARGERIAREAIGRGVNYIDTAPDYAATGTESALGRAMAGQREGMFVATKFCTARGHLQAGAPVEHYVRTIEGSLRRLRTDYVDLAHVHACDSLDRLLDENLHEAFDRLKQAGKLRFLGFSSHTPNLPNVARAAIESDRFDVMMLAYHHGAWPSLAEIIDVAATQDIGVVAMKTLKGAKHRGMAEFVGKQDAYSQAAFKWVLSNPKVSGLVISFFKHRHIDEYLHASGKPLEPSDLALLEQYDRAIAGTHCLPHCGACLSSCPEALPIADVLRQRMYFEDYGLEKQAMQQYARLEKQADVCAGCSAPCTGACPVGLSIQERTLGAHELLTLT